MKFKDKMQNISFGYLKSEKAVDRHFFLKSNIDDSLLQLLATLQSRDEFKSLNVSRLLNLFTLKSIDDLSEMDSEEAFETVSELNTKFMEL